LLLKTEKIGSFIKYKLKYPKVMKAFDIMKEVTKKARK